MVEIRIQQKGSITHTKFILMIGFRCFPESNFTLAKEWHAAGLLDEESTDMMDRIIAKRIEEDRDDFSKAES